MLACLLACLFVGWLVGWLVGWVVGWLVGWLAGWLVGWLAGWLVGCLQRLAGCFGSFRLARKRPAPPQPAPPLLVARGDVGHGALVHITHLAGLGVVCLGGVGWGLVGGFTAGRLKASKEPGGKKGALGFRGSEGGPPPKPPQPPKHRARTPKTTPLPPSPPPKKPHPLRVPRRLLQPHVVKPRVIGQGVGGHLLLIGEPGGGLLWWLRFGVAFWVFCWGGGGDACGAAKTGQVGPLSTETAE